MIKLYLTYRKQFFFCMAISVLYGLGSTALLWFIQNYLLASEGFSFLAFLGFMLVIGIFVAIGFISSYLLAILGHNIIYVMRSQIVKRVLDSEVETLAETGKAKVIASLTSDIQALLQFLLNVPLVARALVMLAFIAFYLSSLSLRLTLVLVVLQSIIVAIQWFITTKNAGNWRQIRASDNLLYADYQQVLEGHRELHLNQYRARNFFYTQFQKTVQTARSWQFKAIRLSGIYTVNVNLALMFQVGVIFFFAQGFDLTDLRTTITFCLSVVMIGEPISNMLDAYVAYTRAKIAHDAQKALSLEPYHPQFVDTNKREESALDLITSSDGIIPQGNFDADLAQEFFGSSAAQVQAQAAAESKEILWQVRKRATKSTAELEARQAELIAQLTREPTGHAGVNEEAAPKTSAADKTAASQQTGQQTLATSSLAQRFANWQTIRFEQVTYSYKGQPEEGAVNVRLVGTTASLQTPEKPKTQKSQTPKAQPDQAAAGTDAQADATKRGGFGLKPVNLELKRGQTTFIIGKNGSGKSTLMMLLAGLYHPTSGKIYVDDYEVTPEDWALYRNLIASVFSDYHLFNTVLDGKGKPITKTHPQYQTALKWLELLEIDTKVALAEGILSTTHLSMGQKKRLGLLIAIMEERPILLLDEWAADQDPHFRRTFYRQIVPLLAKNGVTLVAISHDDAYFDQAGQIVVVANGQVTQIDSTSDAIGAIEFAELVEHEESVEHSNEELVAQSND